ncbi:porin PorA family protein [Nocardia africana]
MTLGVVFIAAAAILKFAVLPTMMKLPSDLNQAQKYEGTIQALDPQAFASNDLAHLLTPETPITADRSVKVDAVDGDTAIVTSKALLNLPDGSKQPDVHTYAVSRIDFAPVTISPDEEKSLIPADEQTTFEPHQGVAFSWPMNPPKDGTTLYDPITRTAQAATFKSEGKLEGREVYNYRVDAGGPITSPAVLSQFKSFPSRLPKSAIAGLLQAEVVPPASRTALAAALPTMPDLVDIHFTSTNLVNAAVDRQFGAPLKIDQTQRMYASVPVAGKDLPTLPLSTLKLHTADSEIPSAANTLKKNSIILAIGGLWVPLILLLAGLALTALGILRRRKPA